MPADPAAPVTEPRADCVFCGRRDRGEYVRAAGSRVVMRFEPLNPVTPGHMLFMPFAHVEDAAKMPRVAGDVFEAAALWAAGCSLPFNLITSAGAAAAQTVRHLHVHYVPRRPDDGLLLPWSDLPAALLDEHEQQIRAKVAGEFTDLIAGAEPVICADEDDPVAPPVLAVAVVDVQRILAARGTEGGTR